MSGNGFFFYMRYILRHAPASTAVTVFGTARSIGCFAGKVLEEAVAVIVREVSFGCVNTWQMATPCDLMDFRKTSPFKLLLKSSLW